MTYGLNYLHDITRRFGPEHYAVDLSLIRTQPDVRQRICRVSPALFASLDDYTCSVPTSPRSGRVYKKNLGWRAFIPKWDERLATDPALAHCDYRESEPERWWIYFVRNGFWIEDRGPEKGQKVYGQLHHPYRLLVDPALG